MDMNSPVPVLKIPPGVSLFVEKKLNFANEGAVMPSNIFVPIVDLWSLYDNSNKAIPIVKNGFTVNEAKLNEIKEICQKRKK